ncbi:MAG: insulinase family protein [Bacteroidales bacterium]|nr:insulinase family protein [Candidatus Physcousia equi]
MRLVCCPSATDVVYCGICVDAGTRHEQPGEEGIAHFVEHLSFKGTERRRSWHIINRMEAVGGDLNAFTGKDATFYHCSVLRDHFARALDLLLDIVLHSTYPQHEMDKEVEVVCDEIESYNDTPSELIFDEFENIIFRNTPLGHSILGEAKLLRQLKSDDVRRFTQRLYRPERMVLFVMGNVPPQRIIRLTEGFFRKYPLAPTSALTTGQSSSRQVLSDALQPTAPRFFEVRKQTNQAHVMMGCEAFGSSDPRSLALRLLNNMLGGPGMNSRFNLALRERCGLVYTVESNYTAYTDTGLWTVYFGCDPHDVERCRRLVMKELRRLTDAPLSAAQLAAAKRQFIGQIGLSYDSFESVAIGMARRYLHHGTTITPEQRYEQIEALTSELLHQVAQALFLPEKLTTLVYR